jgi:hypothetical protein
VNKKKLLLLTMVLSGLLVLAACAPEPAPETAPEEPKQPPRPEPTEPNTDEPYPVPDPAGGAQPIDPNAYPAPGEVVSDEPAGVDPYPGVEDDAGNREPSELLKPKDLADKDLQSGPVYIDATQLIMKESYPVQVELLVVGNLPTPCHHLRVDTTEPDEDGHIQIQIYSVSNPDTMCAQVLEPFEAAIPLGDFTEGNFTYSINDEFDGKFQLP